MRGAIALAAAALLGAASAAPQLTTLFEAYTGYPTCYRQPILLSLPNDVLLAFIEGRPGIPYCSGTFWPDAPDFPIMLRRSTDNGQTWGAASNITVGNLDFLVAVYDAITATAILMVQEGDNDVIVTQSTNAGVSWSQPQFLTLPGSTAWASVIPGVGHGIQISPAYCLDPTCGGAAGRLIMPFVFTSLGPVSNDTACGSCLTGLIYSDDHGASWQIGAVSDQNGSREASLVQLNSASYSSVGAVIYASERNLGNATGTRWHSVSLDGGRSFSPKLDAFDPTLPDSVDANWTGVVSGAARFDTRDSNGARVSFVVYSAPANRTARADMSLWVSGNQALSWGSATSTVWAGPAAYSDLLQINDTHLGIVFENGDDEFAQRISFAAISLADLPVQQN